jgi:hypothetical protein
VENEAYLDMSKNGRVYVLFLTCSMKVSFMWRTLKVVVVVNSIFQKVSNHDHKKKQFYTTKQDFFIIYSQHVTAIKYLR